MTEPMVPGDGATVAIIAGVNKAGTTSLFVSLAARPDVAAAVVKETRFFLPARYGLAVGTAADYASYFPDRPGLRLEASPSYCYGGRAVAERIAATVDDPRIILVLREPVARAISFFTFQKARLRLPADLDLAGYLEAADRLGPEAFTDPDNEPWFAVGGGRYADWLPDWYDVFGTERVHVVFFEDLVADSGRVLGAVTDRLGLAPSSSADALSSENRTTGFRVAALQRLALAGNDRFERVLRRHPQIKRRIRAAYYRLNGRPIAEPVPPAVRAGLVERFREPNARLAAQLQAAGVELPGWLAGSQA
jgi:hypothetical protein